MLSISFRNSATTVVFDAVGTLLYAQPSVAEAYRNAALRFGWSGNLADIETRFNVAFKSASGREHDLVTSEAIQRVRWREVVGRVFSDLPQPTVDSIFADLWEHFAQPKSWSIYPDAIDVIELLDASQIRWCIASNFDARLHQVLAGMPELATCHRVFCSSEVGFDKPAVDFYFQIEQALGLDSSQLIMVGDDMQHDALAAESAGWIGLHIHRDSSKIPGKPSAAQVLDGPPQITALTEIEPWLM